MAELIHEAARSLDVVAFRSSLLTWGSEHFRSLPWRLTENPYHILMAEVMLHRTQAPQVVPVYQTFIERFPTIAELSNAPREDLHRVLHSLGLRWRIDLIQDMGADLVFRFKGQVPRDRDELLSLPGVSEYIAGAVRCFAWNLAEPLVDTNTVRVTGRLFGLTTKDSSRRNSKFRRLIAALVERQDPRMYSFALLDLADQICTKKRPPACHLCPVNVHCSFCRDTHVC